MRVTLTAALLLSAAVPVAHAQSEGEVEKVVVTASPLARSNDKFSNIVTTLDRNRVLKEGGGSIGDALEKELAELFYIQSDARFWGFEIEGPYDVTKFGDYVFGVTAQADYVRGKLESAGSPIDRTAS
jgi:hypothetical protein